MSAIKDIFAFKTVFADQKTYLVYSISKKEKINYSQVQMFQNDEYSNYFVPFQCTKTATTNKVSFDISGLTSLSEYLKSSLQQSEYFSIIMGIQKIISFCQEHHLSYDNLVCSPKFMFYHNVHKRVLMAYVPLNNAHYIRDSIPQCLIKIHKCAENVIITDGNYMNAYEAYLSSFLDSADKKSNQAFSPNSLLHFFNVHEKSEMKSITIETQSRRDDVSIRHSIMEQVDQSAPMPSPTAPPPPVQTAPPPPPSYPMPEPGGTVVRKKSRTYLTDQNGSRYEIVGSSFTIGRVPGKDLVIPADTVSSNHAKIELQDGGYYVKDTSTNGTFLNDSNERAVSERLKDGDRIYFDEFCYVFHQEKEPDPAPAPTPEPEQGTGTLMVSRRSRLEKPVAYIKRAADNSTIRILAYPFSNPALSGIVFMSENQAGRTVLLVANYSSYAIRLEDRTIDVGQKEEIFSGCSLYVHDEKYMFFVEN